MDRFWRKVEKTPGCWNWMGGTLSGRYGGYSVVRDGKRAHEYAHRVAFEATYGPIPIGSVIDHKCHNTKCVNPEHLRAVSQKQNGENKTGPNVNNRSSGVRGVTWDKSRELWSTQVMSNRRNYSAGRFADLGEATRAVIALRTQLHTCNDLDRLPAA